MTGSTRTCYCAFIRTVDLNGHGAEFLRSTILQ